MSDFYPPGVRRLPDDKVEVVECSNCSNMIPSNKDLCESCQADMEMEVDIECPECHIASSPEAWDEATQDVFGEDSEPIVIAVTDPCEGVELWYICPSCYEQVEHTDLKTIKSED